MVTRITCAGDLNWRGALRYDPALRLPLFDPYASRASLGTASVGRSGSTPERSRCRASSSWAMATWRACGALQVHAPRRRPGSRPRAREV